MRIRQILFILFVFVTITKAQIPSDQVNYSIWIDPPNKKVNFIMQMNLRYDLFVFEKTNSGDFETKFNLQLELYDSNWKLYTREFLDAELICKNYEETISQNRYYVGQFNLTLPESQYNMRLTLLDNSNKEVEIGTNKFSFGDSSIQYPVVISQKDLKLIEIDSLHIPFTNFLKFSSEKYLLLLPVKSNIEKATMIFKDSVIDLRKRMSKGLNYYIFSLDSLPLIDNLYILNIETENNKYNVNFRVNWFNKPRSLKDFSLALRLMAYIFDANTIKAIEKKKTEDQYYEFFEKWKKLDKTPKTAFNELISEFYKRADEAAEQFKTLTQLNGALTDRGKIYILYGNPDTIERRFTVEGKAMETWKYNTKIKNKFVFIDENKNGNLILKK